MASNGIAIFSYRMRKVISMRCFNASISTRMAMPRKSSIAPRRIPNAIIIGVNNAEIAGPRIGIAANTAERSKAITTPKTTFLNF